MRKIKVFIFILMWIYVLSNVTGQPRTHLFEQIGFNDGLSSNHTNCILQDSHGFVWIGTNHGLNRYDGYESKVFTHDETDINSISNNYISSILEDSKGNIWIGTWGGGLNLYTLSTGKFRRFKHNPRDSTSISSNSIECLFEDSNLRIWIGSEEGGLSRLNPDGVSFQNWNTNHQDCEKCNYTTTSITEDHMGNLWIGDEYHGLYYFKPALGVFSRPHLNYQGIEFLPSEFIYSLYFEKGYLWIGTDNGLALLNTNTNTFEELIWDEALEGAVLDVFVTKIYKGIEEDLWFCTNGSGLINYDPKKQSTSLYSSEALSTYKLGSNSIADIIIDKSNNVWVATHGRGINKFNLKSLLFDHKGMDPMNKNSLVNSEVRAIYQDIDETVWIGTNKGVSKYESEKDLFTNYISDFNFKADIRSPRIRTIYRCKKGILWVGTLNGGLYRYNDDLDQFQLEEVYTNSPVTSDIRDISSIYEPEDGVLWIGIRANGFVVFDTNKKEVYRLDISRCENDLLGKITINCLIEASGKEVWIGTNRGLILLNTQTLEFETWENVEGDSTSLVDNKIRSLFQDANSDLWIGTRNGLSKFDLATEKFDRYKIEDGLSSDVIFGIMPGVDGNLWLSTSKGLSRVDPTTMEFINIIIPQNNILDMGGHAIGLDGKLMVGGTAGFTIFHPNDLQQNPFVPNVVFTDFKIDHVPVALDTDISELKYIGLNYYQNNLTFEFSSLDYTYSDANKYQYFLEGFNNDWVNYGNKHYVTFTNLPPGDYKLHIKGSNSDGLWNELGVSLDIHILPPWWGTWWFRIFFFSLLVSITATLYFNRINVLKNQEKKLKIEVNNQTRELVKSNTQLEKLYREKDGIINIVAHDLKAPLNNIQSISQLLSLSGKLDEEQKENVEYINRSIELGNSLIMDLLYASEIDHPEKNMSSENFDIQEFVSEWIPTFQAALDRKNQSLNKSIRDEVMMLHADKKLVHRILDNLMSNAIKFSEKGSKIDLSIYLDEGFVAISLKDYGPGMTYKDKKRAFGMFQKLSARPTDGEVSHGLGLAIVKKLVERLNGSIELVSELGKGCEFIVRLPLAET